VIIFDASRGLFPHRLGNDEEGERRVFHVALTRARTQVIALANAEAPSIFLTELDGSRVRTAPGPGSHIRNAAAERSQKPSRSKVGGRPRIRRDREARAEIRLPTAVATLGLVIEDRGNIGTIVEVTAADAVISVGSVRMKVALGSDVRIDGQSVTLIDSAFAGGPDGMTNVEKALRTWRSGIASKDAVPAYVILKDTELEAIAARDPKTLAELATCRGIGQIRLERWGDEILAVLDTVRSA
jgi:superfamily II DNA helicase RecQ